MSYQRIGTISIKNALVAGSILTLFDLYIQRQLLNIFEFYYRPEVKAGKAGKVQEHMLTNFAIIYRVPNSLFLDFLGL